MIHHCTQLADEKHYCSNEDGRYHRLISRHTAVMRIDPLENTPTSVNDFDGQFSSNNVGLDVSTMDVSPATNACSICLMRGGTSCIAGVHIPLGLLD